MSADEWGNPDNKTGVEYDWSSSRQRVYPLHKPDLVEKAVKMANWREGRARQVFLTEPLKLDEVEVHSGQRVWFCNALTSLTRSELIALYNSLRAGAQACLEDGGDFTAPDVRAALPHIYGEGS